MSGELMEQTNPLEQIAQESAELPNRQAWREIGARLRAGGRSTRQANESREVVWLIRRWNADQRRLHGNAESLDA
jgi:hypothetical protein